MIGAKIPKTSYRFCFGLSKNQTLFRNMQRMEKIFDTALFFAHPCILHLYSLKNAYNQAIGYRASSLLRNNRYITSCKNIRKILRFIFEGNLKKLMMVTGQYYRTFSLSGVQNEINPRFSQKENYHFVNIDVGGSAALLFACKPTVSLSFSELSLCLNLLTSSSFFTNFSNSIQISKLGKHLVSCNIEPEG